MNEDTLKSLNAAAPQLRQMIKGAERAADDACEAGLCDLSADLREMQSYLTMAYAIGRRLKDGDGNAIVAYGGGK